MPPFGPPKKQIDTVDDWHFPSEEPQERMSLSPPVLQRVINSSSVSLQNTATSETVTISVGSSAWGWLLTGVATEKKTAMIEYAFDRWAAMAVVDESGGAPRSLLRKPVGQLSKIQMHQYHFNETDPEWFCKQDVDPSDWLGQIASNLSANGETTFEAAASVMAPNADVGIFGNPEDQTKWVLIDSGTVQTFPFARGKGKLGKTLWHVPKPQGCGSFTEQKSGLLGDYLRALTVGMWDEESRCGAEVVAVTAPAPETYSGETQAHIMVKTVLGDADPVVSFVRIIANDTDGSAISIDELDTDGSAFVEALMAQSDKWDPWIAQGSIPTLPSSSRRYSSMSQGLLTAYLNLDRGLVPEYGLGKFANEYNEYLPLDTLALNNALLEWGQHQSSREYLEHFFRNYIDNTTGKIIYSLFGCDGDGDYGRLISTFARAVRYSGDVKWGQMLLPTVEAMAGVLLEKRQAAEAAFPAGHALHGMVTGSPEHDICGNSGHYFSVNVWHVRGFLDLHLLVADYPDLTANKTLENLLQPTAQAWRADIQFAANYTAVRKADGSVYFLHTCVGSDCTSHLNQQEGGSESGCVERGTCWASMTAAYSDYASNYANFRIFSETLHADVLDAEYAEGMMNYRESHRGTMTGMTRFRTVIDDMPILGYGWSALSHDRVESFHRTLAGHSANYLSRGTFWGTEQRTQLGQLSNFRSRNGGSGGEYGSLCMVSSVPVSMWVRWMLVQEDFDEDAVFLARAAPTDWFQASEPFGITDAPTRFGLVSFSIQPSATVVSGSVTLQPHPNAEMKDALYTVRIPSGKGRTVGKVNVQGAEMVSHSETKQTVTLRPTQPQFNFTATFTGGVGSTVAFI
jgi:hypothetical protein